MKFLKTLFLLLITVTVYAQEKTAILKVNPIKGEATVTSLRDQNSIEEIIKNDLIQKGYKVLTKATLTNATATEGKNLLYVDAFIYQYPADYPSVTLTVRKNNYILELLHDTKTLFTDRQSTVETLTKSLVKGLPTSVQESRFLMPTIENLLPHHRTSIYTVTSGAITNGYSKDYNIQLKTNEQEPLNFIIKNSFEEYFSLCLDFNGYRKAVKEEPIVIDFEIDAFGFTHILDLKTPAVVTDKYKGKITAAIEAIPLWNLNNKQPIKGTLVVGVVK